MSESFAQLELAIAQVKWKLQTDLPGHLDTLIAARNDGIDLPYPLEIKGAIENFDDFPVVVVLPADSVPLEDMGFSMIATHTLHIEAFLANTDPEELNTQCLRYCTAIKRAMLANNRRMNLNGSETSYSVQWQGDQYGQGFVISGNEEQTVNSVATRFTLTSDEQ